jgi:hypothetical protein
MSANVLSGNGINDVFTELLWLARHARGNWRRVAPRGLPTLEWKGVFITEYSTPRERVLFNPVRDANPFFHFMEALWILAGRRDVEFLKQFTSNIEQFSDDGRNFHGAYGRRLRLHWAAPGLNQYTDQLVQAIEILRANHDTREVVISLWDPAADLGVVTKDRPCNTTLYLKIRDNRLNLTVACRSNDAILGAYGANVVQFSTIQEFVALAVGVPVGTYAQVSDSFHIYEDSEVWKRLDADRGAAHNPYLEGIEPFPLMSMEGDYKKWLQECEAFCDGVISERLCTFPYFAHVAVPMLRAHRMYRDKEIASKNGRIDRAVDILEAECWAVDWRIAATEWLNRRRDK